MRSVQSPSHLPPHPPGRTPTYVKKTMGLHFPFGKMGIEKNYFLPSPVGVRLGLGEGAPRGPGEAL
jgi:hypothetical protein